MTLQKAFFNEQCKEIEGNNRKFRSRDLFKKTGNMKVLFCTKMGKIKDRYGKDLIEAGEIKRWKDYTEELYKKGLMTWIITMVVTYLQPDILESEVKWALGSITINKASGGD